MSPLTLITLFALTAEPLSLERAVELSLERNLDIINTGLEMEAARWSRLSSLASAGPRVRAEGSIQLWDKALQVALPGTENIPDAPRLSVREQVTASAQLTLVQPIVPLWPILEGLHIKDLNLDISRLKQVQAKRDVTYQATESFYRVLQAKGLVRVSELSIGQVEAQVKKARAFEGQGLMGRNDVLRAELALASAKQRLLLVSGSEALAMARLRTVLRIPASEPLTLVPPASAAERPTYTLETAQETARKQRSEFVEVSARIDQTSAARRIAWSKMLPTVSGVASYQYTQGQALAQKDQLFMGVSAQWDVFEWGNTYFGTREAAVRERQAELGLARVRDGIDLDTQATFVSWDTAREALTVADRSVVIAEENYRIESKRYENAAATTFDVLDSESLLTQARAQRENAWFDLLVAQAGMSRAMGETDAREKESSR